jgi:hypothetical protein
MVDLRCATPLVGFAVCDTAVNLAVCDTAVVSRVGEHKAGLACGEILSA